MWLHNGDMNADDWIKVLLGAVLGGFLKGPLEKMGLAFFNLSTWRRQMAPLRTREGLTLFPQTLGMCSISWLLYDTLKPFDQPVTSGRLLAIVALAILFMLLIAMFVVSVAMFIVKRKELLSEKPPSER